MVRMAQGKQSRRARKLSAGALIQEPKGFGVRSPAVRAKELSEPSKGLRDCLVQGRASW